MRRYHAAGMLTKRSTPARTWKWTSWSPSGHRWPCQVLSPACNPRPGGGTGPRPANVRRWVNISDYGDPIAILRPFKTYFPDVDLDLTESVGLFDFHRAVRYLACASLAATLQPLLQRT